jgi:hypothetical protein
MTFFQKKIVIKYSLFIFILHICENFQTQKKRLIVTCVFEWFQSHRHILKELYEFLRTMSAITIFEKK